MYSVYTVTVVICDASALCMMYSRLSHGRGTKRGDSESGGTELWTWLPNISTFLHYRDDMN